MKYSLVLLCVLGLLASSFAFEDGKYTAIQDPASGRWKVVPGIEQEGSAWASIQNRNIEEGWYVLDVATNPQSSDENQAYGAGFIEGALTQKPIWQAFLTFWNGTMNSSYPEDLLTYLSENDQWVRESVATNQVKDTDDGQYWAQVGLVMAQLDGLSDGYAQYAPHDEQLSKADFILYQANDDLPDLLNILHYEPPTPREVLFHSHCSALIRPTSDLSKLMAGHVTWSPFEGMLRVYKHYNMPFSLKSTKSVKQSFSANPGFLPSGDDFYVTDTNLVVIETTNEILNMSLYSYCNPKQVLYWVRVMVANRMASTGAEWSNIFAKYNSGTYNNQWMIVDNKLYQPGQPIQPNTLWIAEQIPGFVISQDVSAVLEKNGYWPSYNIPYDEWVFNISGYPAYYEKYGNEYSYSMCPRAQIFARDHAKASDLLNFKKLMRYNNYQEDPLSLGDACNAISARCDLDLIKDGAWPFGGIDCKVTDSSLAPNMISHAVAGPTWDQQPVFAWNEQWVGIPHYGQATVFGYDFVPMKPVLP